MIRSLYLIIAPLFLSVHSLLKVDGNCVACIRLCFIGPCQKQQRRRSRAQIQHEGGSRVFYPDHAGGAWVRFPIEARNFNLFGASFGICSWGDLRSRREVEFTTGLTSLTCIKRWRGQPSDQNSTGELANGKFYTVDMTSCPRTLLSFARGYTWAGIICTSSKGSITYSWIMTYWALGIGLRSCVSL